MPRHNIEAPGDKGRDKQGQVHLDLDYLHEKYKHVHDDWLFTPRQAAEYFGAPLSVVKRALRAGELDYVMFTPTTGYRIRMESMREWLKDMQHSSMTVHEKRRRAQREIGMRALRGKASNGPEK